MLNWITSNRNNRQNLTQIYSSTPGTFVRADFNAAIRNRTRLVFVGRTESGKIFGGYTGSGASIPTYQTSSWISGTGMFVFSLNYTNIKWATAYSSSNIWVSTYS